MKSQLIVCMVLIFAILASPAFAGCGKWVIRDNTDFLEDPIFDDAVASSTGSSVTVNPDGMAKEEKNETEENSENGNSINTTVALKVAPIIDLAGTWKVRLEKSPAEQNTGKAINLILIQTGDRLQGYGTLLEDGSDIPATAMGSICNEGISLDLKLSSQKKVYRLDMALVKSELEGSYELYEMETLAENGNATAKRAN
ncbi:MAG: hypothetical protein JW999_01060 [Methanotrichaceae archaeon]|nr:hypothetical protein [Methanotrichaceae archaeon]